MRTNSASTKVRERFGLFLCPVCKDEVEKPLKHGKRDKTCGSRECKKAARATPVRVKSKKEDAAVNLPMSGIIKDHRVKQIKKKADELGLKLSHHFDNPIQNYYKYLYPLYSKCREEFTKSKLKLVGDYMETGVISIENIEYVGISSNTISIPTYVYIMQVDGTTQYKIGVSHNTAKRKIQVSRDIPLVIEGDTLDVVHTQHIGDDAMKLEQFLHNYVAREKNIVGEWFSLDKADLAKIKEVMKYAKDYSVDACILHYKPKKEIIETIVSEIDTSCMTRSDTGKYHNTPYKKFWQSMKRNVRGRKTKLDICDEWNNDNEAFCDYIKPLYDEYMSNMTE